MPGEYSRRSPLQLTSFHCLSSTCALAADTLPRAGHCLPRQRRHTYLQFRDRLGRLADALSDSASRRATWSLCWTGTATATMNAIFAIPMMGAVLQTGEPALPPERLALTLERYGATTLCSSRFPADDRAAGVQAAEGEPLHPAQRPAGAAHDDAAGGRRILEALIELSSPFRLPRLRREDAATTFHTTGTTGKPKGSNSAIARSCCMPSPNLVELAL